MKRITIFIGIAAVLLLVAVAVGVSGLWRPSHEGTANPEDAPQQVALGEQVYREHCASCHGANLQGQTDWRRRGPDCRLPAPPHDETGHTWHHPDDVLFRITKQGVSAIVPDYESDMPAYADVLTDAGIWAVLAFIKSQWPQPIQDRQAEINRRSEQAR